MTTAISLALLVAGILLIMFGNDAMNSFSSDLSRLITGAPTDRAMFILVGGIALSIIGAIGALGLFPGTKR